MQIVRPGRALRVSTITTLMIGLIGAGCESDEPKCSSSATLAIIKDIIIDPTHQSKEVKYIVYAEDGVKLDLVRTVEQKPQHAVCNARLTKTIVRTADEVPEESKKFVDYLARLYVGARESDVSYTVEKTDDGRLLVTFTKQP